MSNHRYHVGDKVLLDGSEILYPSSFDPGRQTYEPTTVVIVSQIPLEEDRINNVPVYLIKFDRTDTDHPNKPFRCSQWLLRDKKGETYLDPEIARYCHEIETREIIDELYQPYSPSTIALATTKVAKDRAVQRRNKTRIESLTLEHFHSRFLTVV